MARKIEILDVLRETRYGVHKYTLLLSRMPKFKYRQPAKNILVASDSYFYSCYYKAGYDHSQQAFGGRVFNIPLKDGSHILAEGNWWAGAIPNPHGAELIEVAITCPKTYKRMPVFVSATLLADKLWQWLGTNEPKTDFIAFKRGII